MTKLRLIIAISSILFLHQLKAQNDTIKLEEVIVSTNRIWLPHFKTSRTLQVISSEEIQKVAATNLADLLQNVAGIDIRRRGVDGTQSDLYIRGGNFDQTLLLIDGVKMDDAQTGHHTMNAILSLDNIDHIEIIKGPAARVFGQNAFAGAINIVTKKIDKDALKLSAVYGSYENIKGSVGYANAFKGGDVYVHLQKQKSDGYRFNTDFDNNSLFLKTRLNNYQLLATFNTRDFGANGFYASPEYIDQYEEIQTSLLALSSTYQIKNIEIKPRISWRRNQDMYLFLRHDPDYFRNFHISNKISAEANMVFSSNLGKTGFGIDLSKVYLVSSNLGDHNRTMVTSFLEHRFEFDKLDITPGIAITHFSDFGTKAFPGIDVGVTVDDNFKLYGNIGYTYRIPTYTDLYYNGPTTQGNPDLKPESALSEELGIKYTSDNLQLNVALFNRMADDLIDWTKENEADKWQAKNFSKVATKGVETSMSYNFKIKDYKQLLLINYSFIDDDIKDVDVAYTRYSLNSIKHQLSSTFTSKFFSLLDQSISYRFVERTDGETYSVVDAKLSMVFNKVELFFNANNIFNTVYTETNLVPMPKSNFMIGVSYNFE